MKAFIDSATSEFAGLVEGPRSHWSVSVEQATARGIVPVRPEQISGIFFATANFANEHVAGRLSFGDREILVNTVVGPARSDARYGLWEWADALGRSELVPTDTGLVVSVARLETIVADMARATATLQEAIAGAPREVFGRVLEARAKVQAELRARSREDAHRRAVAAAAEAFRKGNYGRVVELLDPLADVLSPAERDKLGYAKRHLA